MEFYGGLSVVDFHRLTFGEYSDLVEHRRAVLVEHEKALNR